MLLEEALAYVVGGLGARSGGPESGPNRAGLGFFFFAGPEPKAGAGSGVKKRNELLA